MGFGGATGDGVHAGADLGELIAGLDGGLTLALHRPGKSAHRFEPLVGRAGDLAQFIVTPDGRAPGQALLFLLQVKLLELQ